MKRNLLDLWYEALYVKSSPLSISPFVSRDKVDFIFQTLKSFFGEKYFIIDTNDDRPIEKISWVFSHLSNVKQIGAVGALYEIAEIIKYSYHLDIEIQKELKSLINSAKNLREFFFELYIYWLLDKAEIPNKKKLQIGTQIVEGTFTILQNELLFECRKVFMPNISELDIMHRLMRDIWIAENVHKPTLGFVGSINFKRPLIGKHRFDFRKKITAFFKEFGSFKDASTIDYVIDDDFGVFKVVDFSEAALIEEREINKSDISFYMKPAKVIHPDKLLFHSGKIWVNFSVPRNLIYKKLEAVLKEKKNQHKDSWYSKKVIFIDTEIFPEFYMGLFHKDDSYDIQEVKRICKKLDIKDIVCIVRRYYFKEIPNASFDFIYPLTLKPIVQELKQKLGFESCR